MAAMKYFASVGAAAMLAACGPAEPDVAGGTPDMRRLSEAQYRNVIADVFGPGIEVGGRFDPLIRTDGLLALGARSAPITPAGFEQLEQMARSIAAQALAPSARTAFVGCAPERPDAFDEPCARSFIGRVGRLLFRRPLSEQEQALRVKAASAATADLKDFHRGLAMAVSSLLVAPQFLFAIDTTEPDPKRSGAVRLDGYAKASRLSFFLWNSAPDEALLAAAEKGTLHTDAGVAEQVERMMASPRLHDGVQAFFADMLAFDAFEKLEKDSIIYPAFGLAVADDAREQTLRTISSTLVDAGADYRTLFTTREAAMSRALARLYRVPMKMTERWMDVELTPESGRVGIQSHLSFTALHAHPGRSSPTLRGKAIRETLLCQKIPDPPGDVDFTKFSDPNSPNKTARERLAAHSTEPACAGCHKLTDPIGLALENFDGAGQLRDTEGGAPIVTAGELDGIPYQDAAGLGAALRDNPATTPCVVGRLYSYAIGRTPVATDKAFTTYLHDTFAKDGFTFPNLIRRIATSAALFAVAGKETAS